QLALAHFLKRLGKTVHLYSPGPFGRPEIADLAAQFEQKIAPEVRDQGPVVIVLDCSSLDRIGRLAEDVGGLMTIVIDHHSAGTPFGGIHFIDSSTPAVTLMVQYLIEAMGHTVDATEAKWILFGFCTDTGFFRHLGAEQSEAFDAVARLNRAGASPKQIYGMIFGGRPLGTRVLLGRLLERTEPLLNNKVLLTYETLEDQRAFGTENRDSDSLYQHLQTVEDCEAVVFIREEEVGICTVGLRSNNSIDVGSIAHAFGGGGHKRAAGFTWTGDRLEITRRILETFESALSKNGAPG
ncbi:MAG TPA: bifunctional oligoribonuclease/PAP phosphatase NrnA, partial [Spirochaetia bacterium]|nr:bifunctional oligoribonuclease/PAP phosphatase NrnA [Spirochaetia bacterium]